jgi:hypothetical protein
VACGQRKNEFAAHAELALNPDAPAVPLDNSFHDEEAKTCSHTGSLLRLLEAIKEVRHLILGDA